MAATPISYKRLALGYVLWWVVWGVEQYILLVRYGMDSRTALIDAITTVVIFAMAGYTINTAMHSYRPTGKHALFVLGWSIALAAISVYLQRETLIRLVDDPEYHQFLYQTTVLRASFGWLMIMLIAVLTWFWVYVGEKQDSENRHQEAMKLAKEAELSNLRQQLQPHFLFNSLNSISALAISRPEEARKMVQQLSDFLRGTIKKGDQSFVTLEEELSHLQLYLDIEKVRFGHRLKTETHCDERSQQAQLPSLILQPVVENAIKFGLYNTTGDITITVDARLEGNHLDVTVTNPYDETSTAPSGTGFGLLAVQRRLDLLFSRNDLLRTSRQPGIFITTVTIPQPA